MISVKKNTYTEDKDRILGLLAISSHKLADKGTCPSAEDLDDFNRGVSEPRKREEILAHLDACSTCYNEWLVLPPPEPWYHGLAPQYHKAVEACLSFLNRLAHMNRVFYAVAVTMVIFLMTSLTYFSWQDRLENRIASCYQEISAWEIPFSHYPLPWEGQKTSFGFTGSGRHTPDSRAFGAGMWTGRQRLQASQVSMPDFLTPAWNDPRNTIKENKWSETRHERYFLLGQWSFLAEMICLSDSEISEALREDQVEILDRLKQEFKELGFVNSKLGRIQLVLKNSGTGDLSEKQRYDIGTEIYALAERLSPR